MQQTPTLNPLSNVRYLNLTDTTGLDPAEIAVIVSRFPGLRSLALAHTNLSDDAVVRLIEGQIWPQLVELDLSENALGRIAIERLLNVEIPQDFAWIGLPYCPNNHDHSDALRRKFAGRITSTVSAPPR